MTTMPQNLAVGCPPPPANLHARHLPQIELDLQSTRLYRIHPKNYDPIFYRKATDGLAPCRFDSPTGEFGVLYASPNFEACMAETVIRGIFASSEVPLQIDEQALETRCISRLILPGGRRLRLADLSRPLFPIGGTSQIFSDGDYSKPNEWSQAIHDHPALVDGLYYPSRFSNLACVAVFERTLLVTEGSPIVLSKHPDLEEFFERYRIDIV